MTLHAVQERQVNPRGLLLRRAVIIVQRLEHSDEYLRCVLPQMPRRSHCL